MYSFKSVRSVLGTRSRSPGQDGFDEYHSELSYKNCTKLSAVMASTTSTARTATQAS